MKKRILELIPYGFILFFALCFTQPAFAHGGEPRLEISVERMNPGGIVDLRGVDFEPEEIITLMLVNSRSTISLGEVVADVEGTFVQIVTLPIDLPEGTYNFHATTDDHKVFGPALMVQGPPILQDEGEQDARDETDPLLAPMPTLVPGAPTLTLAEAPVADKPPSDRSYGIVALVGLIVSGAVILLAVMRKQRS